MSDAVPGPVQDRWCDINGAPMGLFSQVEQVADSAERSALLSWLHQRGQVVGRDGDSFYVCFSGNHVISLRPHLLRVLDETLDGG